MPTGVGCMQMFLISCFFAAVSMTALRAAGKAQASHDRFVEGGPFHNANLGAADRSEAVAGQ
jgi:hypothetical protein